MTWFPLRVAQVWAPCLCALLFGCTSEADERARRSRAAATVSVTETLRLTVGGGAVLGVDEGTPKTVRVRALSTDLRLDAESEGCEPEQVIVEISNLGASERLRASTRTLLGALDSEAIAARNAGGGGFTFGVDADDPDRSPLDAERAFEPDLDDGTARFAVTLDRGRGQVRVVGAEARTEPPAARSGACVHFDTPISGRLGGASMVARVRLRRTPLSNTITFGVVGNLAGNAAIRDVILASMAAEPLEFVVVSGDLTSSGSESGLRETIEAFDAALDVPIYATLGDRDVSGDAGDTATAILGQTQFAFDVGAARVLVLDTADATLGADSYGQLAAWLSSSRTLWWPATAPPVAHVVITHTPPFDIHGARGDGFKHRPEAARFAGALGHSDAPLLITSQVAGYRTEQVGPLRVIHSGGGGAPLPDGAGGHHWLRVQIAPSCGGVGASADAGEACDPAQPRSCRAGSHCDDGGVCAPCVTSTRVTP